MEPGVPSATSGPADPAETPDAPGTQPDPPRPPLEPGARPPRTGDRLANVVPILLAALGLVAAVIAWRAGVAAGAADDASRAGLDSARDRATTVVINEGVVAETMDAYLDYERDRRRAETLEAAGIGAAALLNRMEATTHWTSLLPDYLDLAGQFQPTEQRAALLLGAEQRQDIQPLTHFEAADSEYNRLRGLIGAGIVLALALPFLTMAEIGRGRLRLMSALIGSGVFATGLVLAVVAWV